jgi:cysteine desulfurase
MKNPIYLDHAAATPLHVDVLAAMQPYFSDTFYNPSATYLPAVSVRKDLEAARAKVAHWLGARPNEIIFTAGGTEANNLAVRGVLERFPDGNVVVSAIEHESVLAPAQQYTCHLAPVSAEGIVDIDKLITSVDDHTVLVSVMYANNEVGTIQPIRTLSQKLEAIRAQRQKSGNQRPLYLHTDAAQAANYLDLHAARLGVDMVTINGGKIYGPKASGALFVAHHVRLRPQIFGGGQERGLRSGTENVPGSIGLAVALDLVQTKRQEETARLQKLQQLFFDEISERLPQAVVNGSKKHRLPNNVHLTLPGTDNERVLLELESHGILAAAGSACSASNEEPSHVLGAMGLSDTDAQSSLRCTMGQQTTAADVEKTVQTLQAIIDKVKK